MSAEVGRLEVTWRTDTAPDGPARARFDALVRGLVDDVLPDVLAARLGTGATPGAEVCVRRLDLPPVALGWDPLDGWVDGSVDHEASAGLALALDEALVDRLGAGQDVVRYRTREHARRDLALSLLDGRRDRAWAWRLLGLWTDEADTSGVPDLLCGVLGDVAETDGAAAGALVAAVAAAGRLPDLVDFVGPAAVVDAADAAWRAAGGRREAAAADRPGGEAFAGSTLRPVDDAAQVIGEGVVARSVLFRATRAAAAAGDPALRRALAALAVLEAEPALVAGARAHRVVDRVEAAYLARAAGPAVPVAGTGARRPRLTASWPGGDRPAGHPDRLARHPAATTAHAGRADDSAGGQGGGEAASPPPDVAEPTSAPGQGTVASRAPVVGVADAAGASTQGAGPRSATTGAAIGCDDARAAVGTRCPEGLGRDPGGARTSSGTRWDGAASTDALATGPDADDSGRRWDEAPARDGLAGPARSSRTGSARGRATAGDSDHACDAHHRNHMVHGGDAGTGGDDPLAWSAGTVAAATTWAGLLFLLPLLDELRLPQHWAASADRLGSPRSALYTVGVLLLRRAATDDPDVPRPLATDPAALAFAGLRPDADPPDPGTQAARTALEGDADTVVAALGSRVDPAADAATVLARVCRRRGLVEADPGWIDVVLHLDEVDVDVRRAGLDLDPGYLPWLGAVVRFRYG